jgi:hypothetical protein
VLPVAKAIIDLNVAVATQLSGYWSDNEKTRPKPGFLGIADRGSQPVENLIGPNTLQPLQRAVQGM